MEIQLLKENDPSLRNIAQPWDFDVDGSPESLVKSMTKIMFENNGIGLAAPQVGISKRLFIMGNADKLVTCINPVVLNGKGTIRDVEGCLSFPDLWLNVNRFDTIDVKYQDITGNMIETSFSGLIARIYQHELDHLDGICFDTLVGPVSLDFAKQKRKKRSRHSFN